MPQLQVSKGATRKLPPGDVYTIGAGWDPAPGQATVDLDLWVIRNNGGTMEAIFWGNQDWFSTDPNEVNGAGKPWVKTPEGDVVYKGDDTTGEQSATGYDEEMILTLGKAPAAVTQYLVFLTNYDEPEVNPPTKSLGEATNIVCGVKNEATGNELVADVEQENAFDVTVLLCTIDRQADGSWTMSKPEKAEDRGWTDSMITVATKLGVNFG